MPTPTLYGKRFAFYLNEKVFEELRKEAEEKNINIAAHIRAIINERKIKKEYR